MSNKYTAKSKFCSLVGVFFYNNLFIKTTVQHIYFVNTMSVLRRIHNRNQANKKNGFEKGFWFPHHSFKGESTFWPITAKKTHFYFHHGTSKQRKNDFKV